MYIDTHAHLFLKDNPFEDFDFEVVFSDSVKAGLGQIWLASTAKGDIKKNIEFAKKHPKNVKAWVGFHPENYKEFDLGFLEGILKKDITHPSQRLRRVTSSNTSSLENQDSLAVIENTRLPRPYLVRPRNDGAGGGGKEPLAVVEDARFYRSQAPSRMTQVSIVGVGEVGVDLNWNDKSTAKSQQQVFEDQIKLANKYSLPVAIHSRDAFDETIEVMQSFKNTRFVWHCFNLDKKQTEKTLSIFPNIYVGLNAIVTYKSGSYIWDSLHQVSSSKLLIETDCPFLKPRSGFIKSESLSTKFETNSKPQIKNSEIRDSSPFDKLRTLNDQVAESGLLNLKYNTPYGVVPVYNFVAQKLNISVEELERLVEENCKRLLINL